MKCLKHAGKDAVAICERCNLYYCGDCALSSGGRCPACGNILSSPRTMLPFEIDKTELYKGKGSPRLQEAMTSLYLEPIRAIRRIQQYSSLVTGMMNVSLLYATMVFAYFALVLIVLLLVAPRGQGLQPLEPQILFALLVNVIIGFGIAVLSWFASSFTLYLPARLLGGKGTFVDHACLLSYAMLVIAPPSLLTLVIFMIPYVGIFLALFWAAAVFFYSLFLVFLIIREINGLGAIMTVASMALSAILQAFIAIALALLFLLPIILEVFGKLLPL